MSQDNIDPVLREAEVEPNESISYRTWMHHAARNVEGDIRGVRTIDRPRLGYESLGEIPVSHIRQFLLRQVSLPGMSSS
jgi:hypothetical protein